MELGRHTLREGGTGANEEERPLKDQPYPNAQVGKSIRAETLWADKNYRRGQEAWEDLPALCRQLWGVSKEKKVKTNTLM